MNKSEKTGPELSGAKKNNPFIVPDKYFDNFSDRLYEKIHGKEEQTVFIRIFRKYTPQLRYILSVAGIVLIVFILYKIFYQDPKIETTLQSEIAELIEEEIYYYNEQSIIDAIHEDVLNSESIDKDDPDENSPDEIIDYLIYDDVELSSVIEQL